MSDELSRVEIEEVFIAAPQDTDQWVFSGDVSDLMEYVFSSSWAEYVYDEYPSYFWSDVLSDLENRTAVTEIVIDMVYDFGGSNPDEIKSYMEKYKDAGSRFLIMPRTDNVTMACAWLRGYTLRDVEAL